MDAPFDPADIASHLPRRADGTPASVRGLAPMTGGATSEIWSFTTDITDTADANGAGGRDVALVLRRSVHVSAEGPSITTQSAAMRAARDAGVPVPRVYAYGDDDPRLGNFAILSRVEGETIPRRIHRDPDLAGARAKFAADAGVALAALRKVDPASVPGLEGGDPLDALCARLEELGAPSATFEWALRHLRATRPPAGPERVVHGDFRMGNLVIGPEGVRGVLDWELVHRGDPLEDLGWLCAKPWRFGGDSPVGGLGSREDLLGAYEAAARSRVDPDHLHWWEIFGTLKWGVICMQQAERHFSGTPSVELAAIGRRVAEVEWDLLALLPLHRGSEVSGPAAGAGEARPAEPAAPGARSGAGEGQESLSAGQLPPGDPLYGSPTGPELLAAVEHFLRNETGGLEPLAAFHARVAANVVAIVAREMEAGKGAREAMTFAYAPFGAHDEQALADAVREGRLDGRTDELRRALETVVGCRLEVANPKYLHTNPLPGDGE